MKHLNSFQIDRSIEILPSFVKTREIFETVELGEDVHQVRLSPISSESIFGNVLSIGANDLLIFHAFAFGKPIEITSPRNYHHENNYRFYLQKQKEKKCRDSLIHITALFLKCIKKLFRIGNSKNLSGKSRNISITHYSNLSDSSLWKKFDQPLPGLKE
jgi:hypothetical protein